MNTIVVYHKSDFDGIFCRQIAFKYFGANAEYIGWDYGDPIPVVPDDIDLYILDLSISELMSHPRLTWIDHHKSAIDKYDPDTIGLRIDGVAACRLAWQYFNDPNGSIDIYDKVSYVDHIVEEPLAVRLAGLFDIWDKRDPRAELFQFGLRSEVISPDHWTKMLNYGPYCS